MSRVAPPKQPVTISSFGPVVAGSGFLWTLRVVARLQEAYEFRWQLVTCGDLDDAARIVNDYKMSDRIALLEGNGPEQTSQIIASTQIALWFDDEPTELYSLMSAGVPVIVPANNGFSDLPCDAVIKIEQDEYAAPVLAAYVQRLIEDRSLRERIGANARRYAFAHNNDQLKPATDANGRLARIEGLDYRRGAIEYARSLGPSDRYHLFTKPFYNLANKHTEKYPGHGIDADTYRHFCDFANIAFTLALPAGARILDVGCGSGWLCEYFGRFGYDATGIDISPDLIEIAEERLKRLPFGLDHETKVGCRYMVHDIESAPLGERFDAVICYDSLHHFEDEHSVVSNLAEMLDYGGLLFVLEGDRPPDNSADADELRNVMRRYETLECPFSHDYLRELLVEHGFSVVGDYTSVSGLFEREMISGCRLVVEPSPVNYLLCKKVRRKGETRLADSRNPGVLLAVFKVVENAPECVAPGEVMHLTLEIENAGDTLWLVSPCPLKGTVRVGIKTFEGAGALIREEHGRPPLPHPLAPGEKSTVNFEYRVPGRPGAYSLKIDLVDQDICWFEQHGSNPLVFKFSVDAL
jgi:SAM-dependent methyltransferase